MRRRHLLAATAAALPAAALPRPLRAEARAVCYNCPPEWADWGSALRAIRDRLGIVMPHDNKNSGQALAALIAEKARPVADVVYMGGNFGPRAVAAGVLAPYRPALIAEVPEGMKDPAGHWFAIHSGTLGLFVNTEALGRGVPVPEGWNDLLKPVYRGKVGYLNPVSAAVGQVGLFAVNLALGGSYEDFGPGARFFAALKANDPIVPTQTAYARVVSGEIPILFDYDFNAMRAQFTDRAPVRFVLPQEGTISFPYVMGLVANAPHAENGKKVLDFTLSDEGQRIWANAYLRPVRPTVALPSAVASRFLPASEYARARPVDIERMVATQDAAVARYRAELGV
ncbi:extracellular solute-binding protein [Elioraea sp.]|uniref:extracellular solute-binding protein n=1 Tax=Elioraea sp. TaxID=2185103 RepID=UPI00307E36D9